jgi:hypothetical protein
MRMYAYRRWPACTISGLRATEHSATGSWILSESQSNEWQTLMPSLDTRMAVQCPDDDLALEFSSIGFFSMAK